MKLKNIPLFFLVLGIVFIVIGALLSFRVFNRIGENRLQLQRQTDITLIEGWMTIPYVSRTYGVPIEIFEQKLTLPKQFNRKANIDELAKSLHIDTATLLQKIRTIVVQFQQEQQTPPFYTR